MVRLAAERHLHDLEAAEARKLRWRSDLAGRPIRFIEQLLRLPDGSSPFVLFPWQRFIAGSLFGWTMADDGTRRFRSALILTGKGSGKSPFAAALLLYSMLEDGEPSAEAYSAAPSRDQSMIVFRDAAKMVQASPALRRLVEVQEQGLYHHASGSVAKALSSEARTLDGRRISFAACDELQEHASPDAVDKVRASTKGRRQPLILELLNAGWDRTSLAWQHYTHSREILEGVRVNDEWFAFIAELDADDDWKDETCWPKANPSLPQLPGVRYLRGQVREAEGLPARESIVRRLNFCNWTAAGTPWLNLDHVRAATGSGITLADFAGSPCMVGIDLGTTESMTVVALLARDDTTTSVFVHAFLPGEHVLSLAARDKQPYDLWVREGHLSITPGPIVDLETVRAYIRGLASKASVQALAYDDWGATAFAQQLETDGLAAIKIDQSPKGLAAACRELERLLAEGRLRVATSPLFEAHCANAVARLSRSDAEFMMPAKASDTQRIDALSAVLTALAGALLVPPAPVSVYDLRAARGEPVLLVV
jgi:phage terminase large subunit-like protein